MKGSHPRPADWCPFVLGHSISQVTSFMQLGMLWMSNLIPSKVWDEIMFPFQDFNGCNVKVQE